jgi:hypothetical protein
MAGERIVYLNPETSRVTVVVPVPSAQAPDESDADFVARVAAQVVPEGVSHSVVDVGDLPGDRTFRNAWALADGAIDVDMPAAREMHMDVIRIDRDKALETLDVTFMRAVESGDTDAQAAVAAEKQVLRDIPQTFDLSPHANADDLNAAWPDGLPRSPES